MRIFFIWVFLLSCTISHLESCMLSAVLKDLCLSEEVPFIFLLSQSSMWTFKHKANFFTSITLDMLSQLYPQITVLEIRLLFFTCLFSTYAWISALGLNSRPHNQVCGKTAHSQGFIFLWDLQDNYKEPLKFFARATKLLFLQTMLLVGLMESDLMKSLGFEELYICKSPKAQVLLLKA